MWKFKPYQQHKINVLNGTFDYDPTRDDEHYHGTHDLTLTIYPGFSNRDYIQPVDGEWDYKKDQIINPKPNKIHQKYLKWIYKNYGFTPMTTDKDGVWFKPSYSYARCHMFEYNEYGYLQQTKWRLTYGLFGCRMYGHTTTKADLFHTFVVWNLDQYFKAKYSGFMDSEYSSYTTILENINQQYLDLMWEEREIRYLNRLREVELDRVFKKNNNKTKKEISLLLAMGG